MNKFKRIFNKIKTDTKNNDKDEFCELLFLKEKIDDFMSSKKRSFMLVGQKYYENENDINSFENKSEVVPYYNVKTRLSHPFVRKITDQKVQYILGRPFSIKAKEKQVLNSLYDIFNDNFMRDLKDVCKESINKGVSYLQVYFCQNKIKFRKIPSEEIIPIFKDDGNRELLSVIRVYNKTEYKNEKKVYKTIVKWYKSDGINNYIYENNKLKIDDKMPKEPHFYFNGQGYNFNKIPFVYFKYNEEEIPLIKYIKSLIDDYDRLTSIDSDTILEQPNAIYVLTNYDGENLSEFRENLFKYRAVKVSDGGEIDIKTADINTQNVIEHLLMTRRDIYELGRGVDTQNERVSKASGVALKFLYADIDLDCNGIELEFKSSLKYLMNFIEIFLTIKNNNKKIGNIKNVEFVFNRRMIINESEAILDCKNSKGIIDDKTIVTNHPWVVKNIM